MKDIWHKTKVYFGFADEVIDQMDDDDDDTSDIFDMPPTVRKISRSEAAKAVNKHRGRNATPTKLRPVVNNQAKVHVVEPRNFNDAQRIADKFKIDIPVILNLQQVDPSLSKRILDFVSGLTYSLDGGIQKIADKVFMLTPRNIDVSDEEKRRLQQKGFFNQF